MNNPKDRAINRRGFAWILVFVWTVVISVTLATAVKAADTNSLASRKTIVILGDSLAAGAGVDPSEAYPALVQEKVNAAGWNYEVVNAGVSGDTTAGGLRRMDWLLRRKVDVLVVELGGNDGLRGIPVEATKTNLQTIIDKAKKKYPEVKIIVAGMQMPPNMGEEYNNAFQKIFPDVAKANGATLIPFVLEGVGGKPELNQPDQIHPNVEGHKIVAENVWKVLKLVLEKANPPK